MPEQQWNDISGYDLDAGGSDELEIVQEGYGRYRRPDAEPPEDKARRNRIARNRFRFAVVILVVVVGGAVLLSSGQSGENEESQLREIASLSSAAYLFATEDTSAVGMIKRRFGSSGQLLPFTNGIVVSYLFLNHPVEIWVGFCNLQELARDAYAMLRAATDPATNTDWRTQSQFDREGRTITHVAGRGQRNYFFQDSNMVIWVTADSIAAVYALQATLNTNIRDWLDTVRFGR